MLQSNSTIKLPDSSSEKRPQNQLMIAIDADDIIVQGRAVAKVTDLAGPELVIPVSRKSSTIRRAGSPRLPEGGFEVTIMGDKEIPYWLLKKIMYTCQTSDFARIALAVNGVTEQEESTEGAS